MAIRPREGRIILFRLCATPSVYFCFVSLAGRKNYTQPEQKVKRFLLRRFASVRRSVFSYFSSSADGRGYSTSDLLLLQRLAFACAPWNLYSQFFWNFHFANSFRFISQALLICIRRSIWVRSYKNYLLPAFKFRNLLLVKEKNVLGMKILNFAKNTSFL